MENKHKKGFLDASVKSVMIVDALPKADVQYTEEIIYAMAEQAAVKLHGTLIGRELVKRRQEIIGLAASEANTVMFGAKGALTIADFSRNPELRLKIMGDFIQDYMNGRRLDSTPPPPNYSLN